MIRWLLLLLASAIVLDCGNDSLTRGGGTNVGDESALVMGVIKDEEGPTAGAIVLLHTSDFNPGRDTVEASHRCITGKDGKYVFTVPTAGVYNIEASLPTTGTKALLKGIQKAGTKIVASDLQVQTPGQINVHIPDFLGRANGYVYIPGTSFFSKVHAGSLVNLDSVPPLQDMQIVFADDKDGSLTTLADSINLAAAGKVQVSPFNTWSHVAKVKINPALAGITLTKNILDFPVLVRLNNENFNFSHANSDGSDIRFTKADGVTGLPFEIERWNSALSVAEIWVKVDTLYADSASQTLDLYFGKSNAKSRSDANTVFDSTGGFRGVWHLGENSTSSTVKDAVGNFNGILKSSTKGIFTSSVSKPNIIGTGFEFKDWQNQYWIDLGGNENFVNNLSELSISLWVSAHVDTSEHPNVLALSVAGPLGPDPKSRVVVHFERGFLSMLARTVDTAANMRGFTADSGLPSEPWFYVTGVMNIGLDSMHTYVNGILINSIKTDHLQNTMASGNSTHGAIGSNDIGTGNYFAGLLDEVRLEVKARSPEWVKLCYENQRMGQVLVSIVGVK